MTDVQAGESTTVRPQVLYAEVQEVIHVRATVGEPGSAGYAIWDQYYGREGRLLAEQSWRSGVTEAVTQLTEAEC